MMLDKNQKMYDIAIMGAGPVGLSLGVALARFVPDLRIAVCDVREIGTAHDERSSALALGVSAVFQAIGVWGDMLDEASPIKGMKITDSDLKDKHRPLFLNFEGDVKPGQPFAHMVPNRVTIGALLNTLNTYPNIEILAPIRAVNYQFETEATYIEFENETKIGARLLVAADGVRSAIREKLGIQTFGHDYHQSGIVTTFSHALDHQCFAYEHFLPSGPFATLPLPHQRSSLVWSERTKNVQTYLQMPPEKLAYEIEHRMGGRLGAVKIEAPVQAFPLRLQIARQFIKPRVALVGDAAHVVHPIAGQGLNLGVKDVAALTQVLVSALRMGEDIGSETVLARYQAWRRLDVGLMAAVTDGLNILFSNDMTPLRVMRDVGLGVVDRLGFVKNRLIGHAAAAYEQPKLLNGQAL